MRLSENQVSHFPSHKLVVMLFVDETWNMHGMPHAYIQHAHAGCVTCICTNAHTERDACTCHGHVVIIAAGVCARVIQKHDVEVVEFLLRLNR